MGPIEKLATVPTPQYSPNKSFNLQVQNVLNRWGWSAVASGSVLPVLGTKHGGGGGEFIILVCKKNSTTSRVQYKTI